MSEPLIDESLNVKENATGGKRSYHQIGKQKYGAAIDRDKIIYQTSCDARNNGIQFQNPTTFKKHMKKFHSNPESIMMNQDETALQENAAARVLNQI